MTRLVVRWTAAWLAVLSSYCLIGAQNALQIDLIAAASDTVALRILGDSLMPALIANRDLALQWAQQSGLPARADIENGGVREIRSLIRDDFAVYDASDNRISGQTISTNEVYFGGDLNLDLTGAGYTAYIWDAGVVSPHQEFAVRTAFGGIGDLADTSLHATHVAGTIIAAGNFDTTAKGMAPLANLAYETFNFDIGEMTQVGDRGIMISNHSYSQVTGWNASGSNWYWFGDPQVSLVEDYYFGFYTTDAKYIDEIMYNAPYYLMVKSAGNNRAETGPPPGGVHFAQSPSTGTWALDSTVRNPDGPYECLPPRAVAKNNLVIGAVHDIPHGYTQPSDVVMTSYSGWGPTDDGRLKPDLVTNGHQVRSTIRSNQYDSYSGTSMAAPAATGSILLLQEHYANTHNNTLMRSATAKALVIHTADEAGYDPGPDYQHGWGLMNTAQAADKISQDVTTPTTILELNLSPGDTFAYDFVFTGNAEPFIRATLAWTDPPGTPVAPQVDPTTAMLVNDLDLRLFAVGPPDAEYRPWILDPAAPANAATQGDNFRDNVEVVHLASPLPNAHYRIVVSHKGSGLHNNLPQAFSLVLSGIGSAVSAESAQPPPFPVRVYPSPADERLVFDLGRSGTSSTSGPVKLEMWNAAGQKRLTRDLVAGSRTEIPEIQKWPSALYSYRLTDQKGRMVQGKALVQHLR
ncbi:MAG: S8 family serine peptidase [Bacteroidota bacterium]